MRYPLFFMQSKIHCLKFLQKLSSTFLPSGKINYLMVSLWARRILEMRPMNPLNLYSRKRRKKILAKITVLPWMLSISHSFKSSSDFRTWCLGLLFNGVSCSILLSSRKKGNILPETGISKFHGVRAIQGFSLFTFHFYWFSKLLFQIIVSLFGLNI